MDNHSKLVKIYLFVCTQYENELQFYVQRFSNNRSPKFTDPEIMTIMLYCTTIEERFTIRQTYDFTSNHLLSWFPRLPSYTAFVLRVNRLSEAFRILLQNMLKEYTPLKISKSILMVDSMPIIICSGKRTSKVATEITDKGYCSTKSIYYYGVKLHALTSQIPGTLPLPQSIVITAASESDLNVFRDNWSDWGGKIVFADKAYGDKQMQNNMLSIGSELLTPVKYPRGTPEVIKQMSKAADDLFSRAISSVRQPIESLFNWLIEKAGIQRASKVRSINGLLVHIYAKLAAIFCKKILFNS